MMTQTKWYTPTGALLRLLAWAGGWAAGSQPEIAPLFFFLYGSVDLIGVRGTMKLIQAMRRKKHHARSK